MSEKESAEAKKSADEGRKTKKGEKYSVAVYVVIMATVFTALILLSYFISQRNANQVIQNINQQHTQVQTKALDNIEALQDANMKLTEMVREYDEEISELEAETELMRGETDSAIEKAEELEKELNSLKGEKELRDELVSFAAAVISGDLETASRLSQSLEGKKGSMDTDTMTLYSTMRIQQAQKEAEAKEN